LVRLFHWEKCQMQKNRGNITFFNFTLTPWN
jgi:hypothetical protein